jgi:hypothetical protein
MVERETETDRDRQRQRDKTFYILRYKKRECRHCHITLSCKGCVGAGRAGPFHWGRTDRRPRHALLMGLALSVGLGLGIGCRLGCRLIRVLELLGLRRLWLRAGDHRDGEHGERDDAPSDNEAPLSPNPNTGGSSPRPRRRPRRPKDNPPHCKPHALALPYVIYFCPSYTRP